ncbi:unnamed protein product [Symbiodinium natans]|uniref:CRAL-TRIO domain-containing protein n=1 Tax=Symbiodinium natans TaxID=878477 RepID=A0A812IG55_9DINO|nr:unnamed protein product [Symbiodinium natans]
MATGVMPRESQVVTIAEDLLFFCEEMLEQLQSEASRVTIVADLQGVNLAHLNSQWWKVAVPQLLDLLSDRFDGLLKEVLAVRASRISGAAAQRLLDRHRIPGQVQVGHEVGAMELLEAKGPRKVSTCDRPWSMQVPAPPADCVSYPLSRHSQSCIWGADPTLA